MKFAYTGVGKNSTREKGKFEANSEREVLEFLRANGITPLSLRRIEEHSALFFRKVKSSDIVLFTRQLSSMITAGLTLIEALKVLKEQGNKPGMQEIINDLIGALSEGESFSNALANHKYAFSNVYIASIIAAEKGGLFDKVLSHLATNMERQEDLRRRVRSAMLYPGIVITGVIVVILVMNIVVFPQLGNLYESLNAELPLPTRIVLGVSKIFTTFWPIAIVFLVFGFLIFRRFKKTEDGIKIIDKIMLKLPVFGSIIVLSILDEATRTLSLLIGSGVSIIESLNITAQVANNYWYKNSMLSSSTMVEKGIALSDAFAHEKIFPPMLIHMVRVGESTGKIDESLFKISEYFERDLDVKVRALTTAIEPILIIILGVSVAFLILSVITPIYSLIQQIE